MKGNRRQKALLALGLVAMACLVLAGCPHNGLLDSGGGAGGIGGGSRGGGGGVQLVITNFVADGGASRSVSWLGGPQRTIAPEHIDLTSQTEIEKYVFVAYGNGNGTYGPEFIEVTPNSGVASLNINGGGVWSITVEAYDVEALKAALTLGDRNAILASDPQDVVAQKNTAMVLSGTATLDLSGGSQVTVTLTNDPVTTTGSVNVAIHFTDQADVQKIFAGQSTYTVSAELVNLATQQVVMVNTDSSSQMLFATTAAGGGATDTDPTGAGGYKYRTYDVQNKYQDVTLTTAGGNTNKVLVYKPQAAAGGDLKVPKGKYMLRVVVKNTADNTVLYRVDPVFYVDGNRATTGEFKISGLIGVPPNKLDKFDVYWTKPTTTDQLVGYEATFVWDENDFRAAGYTLEVADITSIYKYDAAAMKITVQTGDETFTDSETLWAILDDNNKVPDPAKYVTRLDWHTTPQDHQGIPRWVYGSLLGGNRILSLRLDSGHVYTARIRAVNGSHSFSDWAYIGGSATAPRHPNPLIVFEKFQVPETKGIFDLMKFSYRLTSTDMWTLTAPRNTDMRVSNAADNQVVGESLLEVKEYNPDTAAVLGYSFNGNTVAAQTDDQVLVVKGDVDLKIVQSWQGWQNKKAGSANEIFGPATGPKALGGAWTKADWKYEGFKDLELEPVGAGGSSLKLLAETSGTFDVLNLKTVGFADAAPNGTTNRTTLENLTQFAQLATPGVYRNAAATRLVVVIQRDTNQTPTTYTELPLYVSVGDNDTDKVAPTLTDKNGNKIGVYNLEVEIQQNTTLLKSSAGFTSATTDVPAYAVFDNTNRNGLMGMMSGSEYTMMVKMTPDRGYEQTVQLPMTILYTDQAATATIP